MQKIKPLVQVPTDVLNHLILEATLHFPKETGGVLLGRKDKEGYAITHLIGPGPNAIHATRSFTPDDAYHEQEIAAVYKASRGEIVYLGDWHTHPGESAYLSSLDKVTLKKIADYKPARMPEPLMMIWGTHPIELRCWHYGKKVWGKGSYIELPVHYQQESSKKEL